MPKSISRRNFNAQILIGSSALCIPAIIPSNSKALGQFLIGIALNSIRNITIKSLIKSGARFAARDLSNGFRQNVPTRFIPDFDGKLVKSFTGDFSENLYSNVRTGLYENTSAPMTQTQFYTDPNFRLARNKFIRSTRGGLTLSAAHTTSRSYTYLISGVELIALYALMQKSLNDGHSKETVAASLYPVGATFHNGDTPKYRRKDWDNYQDRIRTFETPTGSGSIKSRYVVKTGEFEFTAQFSANPSLVLNCDPRCKAKNLHFEIFRYRGHIEDFA